MCARGELINQRQAIFDRPIRTVPPPLSLSLSRRYCYERAVHANVSPANRMFYRLMHVHTRQGGQRRPCYAHIYFEALRFRDRWDDYSNGVEWSVVVATLQQPRSFSIIKRCRGLIVVARWSTVVRRGVDGRIIREKEEEEDADPLITGIK